MAKHKNLRVEIVRAEYDKEKKYAVVEDITFLQPKKDERGKTVTELVDSGKKDSEGEPIRYSKVVMEEVTKRVAVEYKQGKQIKLAHFPHTKQGLEEAKEVLKALK